MEERDSRKHRNEFWEVPLEEVAGKVSGKLHAPGDDFDAIEIHANIKRGVEVPLSGASSFPDVIRKYIDMRDKQNEKLPGRIAIVKAELQADRTKLAGLAEGDDKEVFASKVDSGERKLRILEHQEFTEKKRMRLEFADTMLGSLLRHFNQESMAVDGKRAEQGVTEVQAYVLHEKEGWDKLFPEKKGRLSKVVDAARGK